MQLFTKSGTKFTKNINLIKEKDKQNFENQNNN